MFVNVASIFAVSQMPVDSCVKALILINALQFNCCGLSRCRRRSIKSAHHIAVQHLLRADLVTCIIRSQINECFRDLLGLAQTFHRPTVDPVLTYARRRLLNERRLNVVGASRVGSNFLLGYCTAAFVQCERRPPAKPAA